MYHIGVVDLMCDARTALTSSATDSQCSFITSSTAHSTHILPDSYWNGHMMCPIVPEARYNRIIQQR